MYLVNIRLFEEMSTKFVLGRYYILLCRKGSAKKRKIMLFEVQFTSAIFFSDLSVVEVITVFPAFNEL